MTDVWSGLNVFQYVSFRALGAAATALIISLLIGPYVIAQLAILKFGQPIREAGEVHKLAELHAAKRGTPTMGGVLILISLFVATLLWAVPTNQFVWLALLSTLFMGIVGFLDDYTKIKQKNSAGISMRLKFSCQALVALGVGLYLILTPETNDMARTLQIPFIKDYIIDLGWFALVFFIFVISGTSNGVNFTDGLDGLAIGCTITTALSYAVFAYVSSNAEMAEYLRIPRIAGTEELTVFCMALAGAGLGFLWYNCNPAQVFMGDTGSLAIGGALSVVAICVSQELLLVIVGGIFVLEAVSVILQIGSFKLTGKRIFSMAPLHHHFELKGWKENTVVVRFWLMSIIFAIVGLASLKLR
jgi:phospho-N-acetylmuramoyl-pentapeptide-transferase